MKYRVFDLETNPDNRGYLVALECMGNVPFDIKRVFYIYGNRYDLPRAGHANQNNEEILVCLSGSCRVFLDDGMHRQHIILKRPDQALYIDRNVWVEIDRFSESCILMALASERYNPADQISNYQKFKEIVK